MRCKTLILLTVAVSATLCSLPHPADATASSESERQHEGKAANPCPSLVELPPSATVEINFEPTFPESLKPAVLRAANVVSRVVQTAVPIRVLVEWQQPTGSALIAQAWPDPIFLDGKWMTTANAEAVVGFNLNGSTPDARIQVRPELAIWHSQESCSLSPDDYDLTTAFIHELVHALGWADTLRLDDGKPSPSSGAHECDGNQGHGCWGDSPDGQAHNEPSIMDELLVDSAGQKLTNSSVYPNPSSELGGVLLASYFFTYPYEDSNGIAAPLELVYPFSHLDEAHFPDELMSKHLETGDVARYLGHITLHVLESLGWDISFNDHFRNRAKLFGLKSVVSGANHHATREHNEPSQNGSASVWWEWVPSGTGVATVSTSGSSFDTTLAVYSGDSVDNLQLIEAADVFGANESIDFSVSEGDSYKIAVAGAGGESGTIALGWSVDTAIQGYSDVEQSDWFIPYVYYLTGEGIVSGFPDGSFRPERNTSRAELLKMLFEGKRLEIQQTSPDPGYPDVDSTNPDHWFWPYVFDATAQGFVEGKVCSSGEWGFCPDEWVSRYEAIKMIHAVFQEIDYRTRDGHCALGTAPPFPDVGEVDWYCQAARWLYESSAIWVNVPAETGSIVSGFSIADYGNYLGGYTIDSEGVLVAPSFINRAEAAKMIANAMNYAGTGGNILPSGSNQKASAARSKSHLFTKLGLLYEQELDELNPSAPDPPILAGGDSKIIHEPFSFDFAEQDEDGDELFYGWGATGGTFSTSDPVNYSAATWHPPDVAQDTTFAVSVVRGDRRGKVGRGTFYFTVPASSNSAASGSLTSPTGTHSSTVAVSADATDLDGLARVAVTFVDGGQELVLCGPDGSAACSGTSGSYSMSNIDPATYAATEGTVTLRLYVEDVPGQVTEVDQLSFTYAPPSDSSSYTLTIQKQGEGDGTVSGGGINCGPGCTTQSVQVAEGTEVTLTATEDANSVLVGFAGPLCFGTGSCTFTMARDLEQSVSFGLPDALAVLYSTPGAGDENVLPNDQIIITFNREINPGPTFGDITLAEKGGSAIPFSAVISDTGSDPRTRLFLIPDQPWTRSLTYEVEIPVAAVEDDAGEDLPLPYPFEFTVAPEDAPNMYVAAYPLDIMEDDRTTLSVWFDQPAEEDFEVSFTSSPAGIVEHWSFGIVNAGEQVFELRIDSINDSTSLADKAATIYVDAPGFGQQSVQIDVYNETQNVGTTLKWAGLAVSNDDNGNGILEAGEFADIELFVQNSGSSTISSVVLNLEVLNTNDIDLLGGSDVCELGSLAAGEVTSCVKSIRIDEELPSGEYYLEVAGSSSGGGFLDQARLSVVNDAVPDFTIGLGSVTSSELEAGRVITLGVHARNYSNGFSWDLLPFEVSIEVDGIETVIYEGLANSRGHFYSVHSFELPVTVPSTPGDHILRARINPDGILTESDLTNNVSEERILRTAEPNQAPVLDPLGGPFSIHVGETFQLTVTATDGNGDPITYSLGSGAPAGLTIDSSTGFLAWTPQCGQKGSYSFDVIATDDEATSDQETIEISVGTSADLGVTLTASTDLAVPGTGVDYSLVVGNSGPSCTQAISVQTSLPSSLTDVSWTCTPSSACGADVGTGSVSDLADLAAVESVTYSITSRIADGASGSVVATGTATIANDAIDPVVSNNSASATTSLRDLDFGDAPDVSLGSSWSLPTRLVDDGARHGVVSGFSLGSVIDGELDGQPTLAADGDDLTSADDDEGVVLSGELVPCGTAQVEVTASAAGFLDAWVDFDTDGAWDTAGEQIFASEPLTGGTNSLSFDVPCFTTPSALAFARFRMSSSGGLAPGGLALDGEVEDYGFMVAQVLHELTVAADGLGAGTVIASPNGINCGTDCQESYQQGSVITLSAQPSFGSTFLGWSGAGCSGTGTCVVTMDSAQAVTATFGVASFPLSVTLTGSGGGSVASQPSGISCNPTCTYEFLYGDIIELIPSANADSEFIGWSGACSGTGTCEVTIAGAESVTAIFDLLEYDLDVSFAGTGSGSIQLQPPDSTCTAPCVETYTIGTEVTATPTPTADSEFVTWSGACTGTGPCTITIDQARSVGVTFDLLQFDLTVSVTDGGSVEVQPPNTVCTGSCVETYTSGETVTLMPTADSGFSFVGWSGSCQGTDACTLTMDQAHSATATFDSSAEVELSVEVLGTGRGGVLSSPKGIDCPSTCAAVFPAGSEISLTPTPSAGSVFVRWSGAGCGKDPICKVELTQAETVQAQFDLACLDSFEDTGGWSTMAGPSDPGTSTSWQRLEGYSRTGHWSWLVAGEDQLKDQILLSTQPLAITSPDATLRFWHTYSTEADFDGGVLEYSTNGGGTWFDILAGNGAKIPADAQRIVTNGYNALLDTCCSNPLAGRDAWSGESLGWIESTVDLGDFLGQELQLRWRFASDDSVVSGLGWNLDDVSVVGVEVCPFNLIFVDGFESGDLSSWGNNSTSQ